ncbi:transcriptional regulator [Burkholderia stabilis]|uniref:Transcriptional regulator n=3 Tax=Burkholderia TaxID=32008 RepID=A0A4V1PSN2_9BURK|nr:MULTISPECIES: metalloregulator ArsR/SmtB family transcription factor [Burkholderia]KML60020.1 ArsR family transcriptional regulator [Burkholderia cepacia]RXV71684.1 transcriptional regulator [Burkholderia stabilis]
MHSTSDPLSAVFAALADPTRRAILVRLAEGAAPVGELARPFDMSAPAISKHLRVLSEAGLIEREVNARWRICRLRADGMRDAHGWLEAYRQYWEESLDRLTAFVEQSCAGGTAGDDAPPRREKS